MSDTMPWAEEPSSNRPIDTIMGTFSSTYHLDRTPLHSAVINGSDTEVKELLEKDSRDIHARYYGKTALQYALDQQSADIVNHLFFHGARLSSDDLVYYEPSDMIWASEQLWYDMIRQALTSRHPPLTDADITEAASILGTRFTEPDIVNYILDAAEFWSVSKAVNEELDSVEQYTPSRPYLVSAPIKGRGHHPVKRIVFKTVSHDQDWGGEGHSELYRGSWTYFEATSSSNPQPIEVQRNVAISDVWRTHVVIWDMHSPPHIVEWLAALKPGDVVSLYAKALYSGWKNYVASAEIRIYTSVV